VPFILPSSFNRYRSDLFLSDLQSSSLITSPLASLGSLLSFYNATLSTLLDKYAPVITKFSNVPSNPTHGSLLPFVLSDPLFVVLKTPVNALTLLFPFHPLSLSTAAITNSSSHPKRSITLTSSLLPLIIITISGKLSINYSTGDRHPPYLPLLHFRLSQTVLLLSLQTGFTNSAFPWLPSPLSSLLTHRQHR